MLTRFGDWVLTRTPERPWSDVYGVARTLLALATASTLLTSSTSTLFRPALGVPPAPYCQGLTQLGIFCWVPEQQLHMAQALAVAILMVVASGWKPKWTCIPHWWITFSLFANSTIPDGGDQLASVITLLLIPVCMTDPRKWHWQAPVGGPASQRVVASHAMLLIRLQIAGLYLHSSLAKLGVQEWVDGTAFYYWVTDPAFGAPSWASSVLLPAVAEAPVIAFMTWSPILLEAGLGVGLLLPSAVRPWLLRLGIAFHLTIAVLMGLVSFGAIMVAALTMYMRESPLSLDHAWPIDGPSRALLRTRVVLSRVGATSVLAGESARRLIR